MLGSGELAAQLMELDLVDELRLFVHPLILGSGRRLFRESPDIRRLRLTNCESTSLGTVALGYLRAD